ncbi:AraC family transcriptional regulator [Deinococcus cellulosilyticus NBRC 106333 = KACC 11606]|uniref:AraC family transcriptional regulator n=2 Tax=Deinococcus cellulosilyticus TaxID=401558 RepID=A0A511N082_DEIC1|nr:AraC family transcriptional regulator [Deinococcus cellulosilyticus NBRC 106333 = KACC 11606]
MELFDSLPDTMFFVKDRAGKYVMVNQTLMHRSGKKHKKELLGHTASVIFPGPIGDNYTQQDLQVIRDGAPIRDRLEMYHLPHSRRQHPTEPQMGWCLTHKFPLRDKEGQVIGVAGISRALPRPDERSSLYARLAVLSDHLQKHHAEDLRIPTLALFTGMSEDQLERATRQVFGLTPKQMLMKIRLETASQLLGTTHLTITEVAHQCGYSDHSAFTRLFRNVVGLTPSQYRATLTH